MRILLVGASGTLGTAVADALSVDAELITASRHGDHPVDITDPDSIAALLESIGTVDAIACTAGVTPFKPLTELTRADYLAGLTDKLLGQIELVSQGIDHLSDGGSFTLVAGIYVGIVAFSLAFAAQAVWLRRRSLPLLRAGLRRGVVR